MTRLHILALYSFNLYTEYVIRNVSLEEFGIGIKIEGRNINNLRYVDDTTIMAESEGALKALLVRVKEASANGGVKLNIKKT